MARFVRGYTDSHPDVLVIPHFVGASPGSTSLRHLRRRFCLILRERFGPAEEVPREVHGLVSRFRESLGSVPADDRVVLVTRASPATTAGTTTSRIPAAGGRGSLIGRSP